jgi:hypothetical protein
MVFWDVTLYSLVDRYQNFGELSHLKMEAAGSSETLMLATRLYEVTSRP